MISKGQTREQVAILLDVTPARVSQIAREMNIERRWALEIGFFYNHKDVVRMLKRNKKPGPKKNGVKK